MIPDQFTNPNNPMAHEVEYCDRRFLNDASLKNRYLCSGDLVQGEPLTQDLLRVLKKDIIWT